MLVIVTGLASAQEQKHVTAAPVRGSLPAILSADNIERDGTYPSIVRLSGKVRIKTPVCLPPGANRKLVCDGYMIVTADEATFDEVSGEIQAHGAVKVVPLFREK